VCETSRLEHAATFYEGAEGFAATVLPFVREGLDLGQPVLVAVPGERLALVRDALTGTPVTLADMGELGRNPGRIIPEIRRFVERHHGRRVRFVGEPIWPSRCACELREATRHEALINVALADAPAAVLCPYDASGLDDAVIEDAERTHPVVIRDGRERASPAYRDPALGLPASCGAPLSEPPDDARALAFDSAGDLRRVRRHAARHAAGAGLGAAPTADLQLAVNEVATNTLRYGGGSGTLRIWRTASRLLCQIDDTGRIGDPLAGRRLPAPDARSGWGLLLAHSVCALVEIRSGADGTSVRLHADLPA
jgi:anti-sigma regulatory factor (Ser/Thr protein kinase)